MTMNEALRHNVAALRQAVYAGQGKSVRVAPTVLTRLLDALDETEAALDRVRALDDCLICGKPHDYRVVTAYESTWRDPDDGHVYRPPILTRRTLRAAIEGGES